MQKQEIRAGELYVAAAPTRSELGSSFGTASWRVKATAIEVGVSREGSKRLDGVRLRLEEPWRCVVSTYVGGRGQLFERTLEPGYEYVCSTAEVAREWKDHDEKQIVEERRLRYELHDRVLATMERLGLPLARSSELGRPKWDARGVMIGAKTFDRWLRRIDPASIADDAIDAFVEAIERSAPAGWHWPEGTPSLASMKAEALAEVAAGVALSDDDLTAETQP